MMGNVPGPRERQLRAMREEHVADIPDFLLVKEPRRADSRTGAPRRRSDQAGEVRRRSREHRGNRHDE